MYWTTTKQCSGSPCNISQFYYNFLLMVFLKYLDKSEEWKIISWFQFSFLNLKCNKQKWNFHFVVTMKLCMELKLSIVSIEYVLSYFSSWRNAKKGCMVLLLFLFVQENLLFQFSLSCPKINLSWSTWNSVHTLNIPALRKCKKSCHIKSMFIILNRIYNH